MRARLGLTQLQLAQRINVSFATVNRWENGQVRPARLAWNQIVELEATKGAPDEAAPEKPAVSIGGVPLDFSANPSAVASVAEATRLTYGPSHERLSAAPS